MPALRVPSCRFAQNWHDGDARYPPRVTEAPRYRTTFVRLLGFLRPYKWSTAISVVLAIGSQAAALIGVYLTGSVANALTKDEHSEIPWLIGAILVLGIARAAMMAGRRLIAGKQALDVELDMRTAIYAKLVRLSFGFYDRHQTGQLMSRATVDLQGVRFFLGYGLIFFFQHTFTIIGVGLVIFLINWKLALISLTIAPFLIAVAYRYSHVSHPLLRDVQQKMADVATVAEENIVGVHVVKSFAQEGAEQEKFERALRRGVRSQREGEQAAGVLRADAQLPAARRAGGGPLRRRPNGRGRLALGRQLRPLQPLPRDAGAAAARARHVDRPGTACDGVRRAHLPGDRRARGDRRRARRARAARRPGPRDVRQRHFRLRPRPPRARRDRPRARRRPGGRADRAHGLRQDDPGVARAAVLRRPGGLGLDRRCRRAGGDPRLAAPRDRRDRAGSVPLLRDGPREHRLRPP